MHLVRSDGPTDGLQLGSTCDSRQIVKEGRSGTIHVEGVMAKRERTSKHKYKNGRYLLTMGECNWRALESWSLEEE